MLKKLITAENCRQCQICCQYDDNDIWDAPFFSKNERDAIPPELEQDITFIVQKELWYPRLERISASDYKCPFLSSVGCRLSSFKPFKCAIWPLYVVRMEGKVAVAYSNVCPFIEDSSEKIMRILGSSFFDHILQIIESNPEFIEPMRSHFSFICYLPIKSSQASDNRILSSGDAKLGGENATTRIGCDNVRK